MARQVRTFWIDLDEGDLGFIMDVKFVLLCWRRASQKRHAVCDAPYLLDGNYFSVLHSDSRLNYTNCMQKGMEGSWKYAD